MYQDGQNEAEIILQSAKNAGRKAALKVGKRVVKMAGRATKKGLFLLLKAALPYLIPILLAILSVGGIASLFYGYQYAPTMEQDIEIAKGEDKRAVFGSINTDLRWSKNEEEELLAKYDELSLSIFNKLESTEDFNARMSEVFSKEVMEAKIISEEDQVDPYRVPWSILACLDNVTGSLNQVWLPKPEEHYKTLEPELTWETETITKTITWEEPVYDKEGNIIDTVTKTKRYDEQIRLLQTVVTFEGVYTNVWQPKTETYYSGDLEITVTYYEWVGQSRQEDYTRLFDLLLEYDIIYELDRQLFLELAGKYDPEYYENLAESLGGGYTGGLNIDLNKQYFKGSLQGTTCWPLPATNTYITSNYGMRIHPIKKKPSFHRGVDLRGAVGTDVYSMENGLIIYAGWFGNIYGNAVIVDHGDYKSYYCHLSKTIAVAGSEVKAGDLIGKVGSTGWSTGPHLHFEVRRLVDGKEQTVNPLSYYGY